MLRPLLFLAAIPLVGACPCCSCGADPDPDEAITKELKTLAGTWVAEHKPRAEGKDGQYTLTFDGHKLVWETIHTVDGKPVLGTKRRFEVTLNPKANPKEINLTWTTGLDEKKSMLGIYALVGDKLTICLGYADERPKKLSRPGLLLTLKKQKADEKKGDVHDRQ